MVLRLRLLASVTLVVIAFVMFVIGRPVIGIIAAGLYVLDLAVVGPALMVRHQRAARARRSR